MISRRDLIKRASFAAAAFPAFSAAAANRNTGVFLNLPSDDDPIYWQKIRREFVIPETESYFNNGTLGAQPRYVLEKVIEHMRKSSVEIARWDFSSDDSEALITGYYPYNNIRSKLAQLINADIEEISLTQNATMGMNFLANGLDLQPGEEVLSTDQEHPGGRCGFQLREKRSGAVWKEVKIPVPANDPDEIVRLFDEAITPGTKVIAFSHISTSPCTVFPVRKICELAKSRGIATFIDGAQALGQVEVNVRDIGCDAYYGSPHKWILAPAGSGFLYLRKAFADRIWTTLASANWDNHEDNGFRLQQRGTGNPSLLKGLEAALDFYFMIGPERIIRRIKTLGDRLRNGLRSIPNVEFFSSLHPEMCAGMTVYRVKGMTGQEMQDEFWNRGRMRPRSLGDKLGVRHCTHIYNTFEEIDRAVEVVVSMASRA